MTIFGCDFSDYDWDRGSMDIKAMHDDGITFMTHKLTEHAPGRVFFHSNVIKFWDRALAASVPFIGCYVVPRSGVPVSTQVDTALKYVHANWMDYAGFFWQVDTERWPYDPVSLSTGTEMCRQLEARTGKQAIHYASVGQYGSAWSQPYPRWNANYPNISRAPYRFAYTRVGGDNGRGWAGHASIWQYCSNTVVGKQVQVDSNAFKGTAVEFATMIGVKRDAPPASAVANVNSVWLG